MRFAEEKENSLHEGRHHELENELLVQGARIGNPVVFQEFIVQGIMRYLFLLRIKARGFLVSRVRPNFAQFLCLDPFEVYVLALSFWQEKVFEKYVDVKSVCDLQLLASQLDHQP